MHLCVLCETPLVGDARTKEHVIPASLGARRRTVKALCRQCNSTTGHAWDAELERQLRPAALLVFPHDHPCGRKQRRIAGADGNDLVLKGGIRGGAAGLQVRSKTEAGRTELHISAPSRKRAIQEIRRRVKTGELPADREEEFIASIEREEATTRVDFTEGVSVGGPVAWNSMLKSMVTAGLLGELTWLDMLTAVLDLRGSGNAAPCLLFRDSPLGPRGEADIPLWRHCVHVETDMEERLVWGYVEYFGTWCAIAQLGKCYLGEPTSWTYCVDPVTGEDLTQAVQVDLTVPKGLIDEMRAAPARAPDIAREQVPDPQPLLDECIRVHGVEGRIGIVETSYSQENPYGGASIREMTWVDEDDDALASPSEGASAP